MLFSAITSEYNVAAVAKHLPGGDTVHEQQLVVYAKACAQPAYTYFKEKFDDKLKPALLAFKAARYFSPSKIAELKPTATDIDFICSFPSTAVMDDLKSELPMYLASAEDVSSHIDPVAWWKSHEADLPNWAKACRLILLVEPYSAASERVLSILLNSFSTQQESALEDNIR